MSNVAREGKDVKIVATNGGNRCSAIFNVKRIATDGNDSGDKWKQQWRQTETIEAKHGKTWTKTAKVDLFV